jgi:hypothetical protein
VLREFDEARHEWVHPRDLVDFRKKLFQTIDTRTTTYRERDL